MYWSTVDARRRTVYTCRIIEVRPVPSTPELALRDVRVVHDQRHPDYRPLDTLDLPAMGLAHLLPPDGGSNSSGDAVSQTSPQRNSSLLHQALTAPRGSSQGSQGSAAAAGGETSEAPPTGPTLDGPESEPKGCGTSEVAVPPSETPTTSVSPPSAPGTLPQSATARTEAAEESGDKATATATASSTSSSSSSSRRSAFDFSRLSPSTLKMLNISDPQRVASLAPGASPAGRGGCGGGGGGGGGGEFGNLTGMIVRLNTAALRSRNVVLGEQQRRGGGEGAPGARGAAASIAARRPRLTPPPRCV